VKAREQELKQLMDRAEQGTGGALVNVIAYKGRLRRCHRRTPGDRYDHARQEMFHPGELAQQFRCQMKAQG
jgi:hypothetical protein